MPQTVQSEQSAKQTSTSNSGSKKARRGVSKRLERDGTSRDEQHSNGFGVEFIFGRELDEIADAEAQLAAFLPKLAKALPQRDMQELAEHMREKSESYQRSLQKVADAHPTRAKRGRRSNKKHHATCEPMRALIKNTAQILKQESESPAKDILAITGLQKAVHYEIASYGSLRAWSELIGDEDAVIFFRRVTDEKKQMDRILSEIGENALAARLESNPDGHDGGRRRQMPGS
jgi:ferritin-like metal-binding protein YciE